ELVQQKLEVRDASGTTVGYLVPLGESGGPLENGAQHELTALRTEVDQARQTINELKAVNERLAIERAELEKERDAYLRSLYHLTRKDFSFTEEEIRERVASIGMFEQFLEELD